MAICSSCGFETSSPGRFCANCGQPLDAAVSSTTNISDLSVTNSFSPTSYITDQRSIATGPLTLEATSKEVQIDAKKGELSAQRFTIASSLHALLPLVGDTHREQNKALFDTALTTLPPVDDALWGKVALVAGVYGNFMWKNALDPAQKQGLWQAIVWAVWYERCFRPKMLDRRLQELLHFFKGCLSDANFLPYALTDIELLTDELDAGNLKKLLQALPDSPSSQEVAQLRQKIDERLAAAASSPPSLNNLLSASLNTGVEIGQTIAAIELLWRFLDRSHETQNQATLDRARRGPSTFEVQRRLAILAGVICRNAVYRYTHGSSGLSEEQLRSAILLADFSVRQGGEKRHVSAAQQHLFLLDGLERMRARSLDPAVFAGELEQKFGDAESATAVWSALIALVNHHLGERRQTGAADPVEADGWVKVFARAVDRLNQSERGQFVAEARRHGISNSISLQILETGPQVGPGPKPEGPLAFLSEERRKEFLESIRSSRLVRTREILRDSRQSLLSALSRVLADQSFQEVLPPRSRLKIGGRKSPDQFPEARRLIMSQDESEQRRALPLFEQAERETTHKDFAPIAREWLLYARARVFGSFRVVAQWEEDRKGMASWEEIWNLAVFYVQMGDLAHALDVLKPGVEQLKAPFSHLQFALYCAVQILEQSKQNKETTAGLTQFLIDNLTKVPLLECYLAWLLLVDEAQLQIDLIEQAHVLGIFQDIFDHPISMLPTEQVLDDEKVEAFQKDLVQRLRLEKTWRLWINDYARRHPTYYKAWQWLSDASERAGDLERAEEALLQTVSIQLNQYQQQQRRGMPQPNLRPLRANLIKLFEFYRRNALSQNSKANFNRYYKMVPELWDGKEAANSLLIGLTRSYLEEMLSTTPKVPIREETKPILWMNLQEDLAAVRDVTDLKRLQERLNTAFDLIPAGQKVAHDRMIFIKGLLADICTLDATEWRREQLLREVDRLNRAIQDASHFVEQEAALRQLRALVSALERVFRAFSDAQRLPPDLQVDPVPLGPGLPDDVTETALVLRVSNPGPGEVTDLRVSCGDKGVIASRKEGVLDHLPEQAEDVVAVPVSVNPGSEQVECRVDLSYQWGIMRDLTSSHALTASRFTFRDFLQQHGVNAWEIPIPYVFDEPIDFTKNDPRLFQGRDSEINLIRTIFFKGQMTGIPPYFHGIRRVGKTSLLRRLALELKEGGIVPILVDLRGISAGSQRSLPVIINSFTHNILTSAAKQGLDVGGISPIAVDHPNPLVEVEPFFEALRERANQRLVLLLDEFQVIVAQVTTPLLDLLRHVHQHDLVRFIISGLMRPETMRQACPETQLFPLMARPVDFLSQSIVEQVLRTPVADFGIEIPDTTVKRVYMQTAGNPNHVAKLAWYGLYRLNAEHRTILAPQDVDEIATQLAGDPANFTSSSLSPLILSPEEQNTAIAFAKALPEQQELMPIEDAFKMFSSAALTPLEEKYILELQGDQIKIKSKMLATFLRQRLAEPLERKQRPSPVVSRRVGLFVDFENIWPQIPRGVGPKAVGDALIAYASEFGEVVCRWACADPRNLLDPMGMRLGLEEAGFDVRFPRGELQRGMPAKNITDFVLLESITDERDHSQPDVYILATGDQDFYEKVVSLIDSGFTVRMVASKSGTHLSPKYGELEEQRKQTRFAEGFTDSDFFIDDLDKILRMMASSRV